ncbi:hypothetical protein MYX77_04930 [Acidobacteriia bacterium AH_259_A11_L15]|nr:hypothetical protein [Acidobacteriia bacterium AH_259_A11_L15]
MHSREWESETITVLTKTYPECSKKYGCLVCTAGINSEGKWRRLYPFPWALFWGKTQKLNFKKWDLITLPTRKRAPDHRPESFEVRPTTIDQELKVVDHIGDWDKRKQFLQPFLDADLEALRGSDRSLGLVKPKEIYDFMQKDRQRITDPDEELTLERTEAAQQLLLIDIEPELVKKSRTPPEPLPWLGYAFTCQGPNCKGHEMMCIDWEIQELFRKQRFEKTREKALWMKDRDLYFVVGTTWRFKTWMIIGLFYPPRAA